MAETLDSVGFYDILYTFMDTFLETPVVFSDIMPLSLTCSLKDGPTS
jgi:hypothetical protein